MAVGEGLQLGNLRCETGASVSKLAYGARTRHPCPFLARAQAKPNAV